MSHRRPPPLFPAYAKGSPPPPPPPQLALPIQPPPPPTPPVEDTRSSSLPPPPPPPSTSSDDHLPPPPPPPPPPIEDPTNSSTTLHPPPPVPLDYKRKTAADFFFSTASSASTSSSSLSEELPPPPPPPPPSVPLDPKEAEEKRLLERKKRIEQALISYQRDASSSSEEDDTSDDDDEKKKKRKKKDKKKSKKKHKKLKGEDTKLSISYYDDKGYVTDYKGDRSLLINDMIPKDKLASYKQDRSSVLGLDGYSLVFNKHKGLVLEPTDSIGYTGLTRYWSKLQNNNNSKSSVVSTIKITPSLLSTDPFTKNQDYIVFPKDQKDDDNALLDDNSNSNSDLVLKRNAELNEMVSKDPHNVKLWLELAEFQDEFDIFNFLGSRRQRAGVVSKARRAIIEKKIAILRRALTENPQSERLTIAYLHTAAKIWDPEQILQLWHRVLDAQSDAFLKSQDRSNTTVFSETLWREYIDFVQSYFKGFTVTHTRTIYLNAIKRMLAKRRSLKPKEKGFDEQVGLVERAILVIVSQWTRFERQAGYSERAIGIYQSLIEFNLFMPHKLSTQPQNTIIANFKTFWDSDQPRIGEVDAVGWSNTKLDAELDNMTLEEMEKLLAQQEQDELDQEEKEKEKEKQHYKKASDFFFDLPPRSPKDMDMNQEQEEQEQLIEEEKEKEKEEIEIENRQMELIEIKQEQEQQEQIQVKQEKEIQSNNNNNNIKIKEEQQQQETISIIEKYDGPYSEWIYKEMTKESKEWLPSKLLDDVEMDDDEKNQSKEEGDDDTERIVLFNDIKDILFRIVREDYKLELVYQFLDFLGVARDETVQMSILPRYSFDNPLRRESSNSIEDNLSSLFLNLEQKSSSSSSSSQVEPTWSKAFNIFNPIKLSNDKFDFIERIFKQSLNRFKGNIELMIHYIQLKSTRNIDESIQLCKQLLEQNRNAVILYDTYASLLLKQGKIQESKKIYQTSLTIVKSQIDSLQPSSTPPLLFNGQPQQQQNQMKKDLEIIYRQYCLVEMQIIYNTVTNDPSLVKKFIKARKPFTEMFTLPIHILCCFIENQFQPFSIKSTPITSSRLLICQKNFESQFKEYFNDNSSTFIVSINFIINYCIFQLLTKDLDSCLEIFNRSLPLFNNSDNDNSRSREGLVIYLVEVITKYGPIIGSAPFKIKNTIFGVLNDYYDHPILLSSFLNWESKSGVINRARQYFDLKTVSTPSTTLWLYSIECDRHRIGAGTRIKSIFERAIESDTQSKHSIVLWRLYILFEFYRNRHRASKSLYYRAIRALPWAKTIWQLAFTKLSNLFNLNELNDIIQLMKEKEIRLRITTTTISPTQTQTQ
ncbi:DUF1740 family protein [Cavenderia fasciculata]|uniref:DUF1740 family protein n=1 Tax=Cavenderia fasciculata TaxID=261658 RepID=F4PI65_CACFS|nr:DUF1740 family protein [Cavenderia fasciculata]EGG25348.1 DUF1740 family protein [Cavenderia fasciculata]|eukprot:XP_004363199.1 DUF1740 family protein [Cavenderia fasciculata]